MGRHDYKVYSEGRISNLVLKNRLVRSATYEGAMTKKGRLTDEMLALYGNLASGGVGMIITGYMVVMPESKNMHRLTCIYDDGYIGEIAAIADEVHKRGDGCKIVAQLNHTGRQVQRDNRIADCVGPSYVPSPILKKKARELSIDEIQRIIQCFVDAIVRVEKAGYDGVQVHAAHGYLLSSFLSPYTNRRNDRYGGSVSNRVSILREIITKAREEVGDFPILIKVNCEDSMEGGIGIDTFPEIAVEIEKAGFDAIEVSGAMWDCLSRTQEELGFFPLPLPESRTRIDAPEKQSYFLPYAEKLDTGIPVILVGGNRNVERLEEIIQKGKIDFFALSRPLICEPDLPNRWLEGRASGKVACVSCNACVVACKFGRTKCMMRENKMLYKSVKRWYPYTWKYVFK